MNRTSSVLRGLALSLACLPLAAFAAGRPITLGSFRALVRIDSPQFSPDGEKIAFLTERADFVHDRYDSTLRVIEGVGGHSRALVRGLKDLGMPRWSPDGRSIDFLATVGGRREVYCVPAGGGTPRELTDAPNGVEQFAVSPDGSTVAYVTPDDSPVSARDRRTHHDLFVIHDDDYQSNAQAVPSHLWLLALASGKTRQLTRGRTSVLQAARVRTASDRLARCREALDHKDFCSLAEVSELDSNILHSVMMTSVPPLIYWLPSTIAVMQDVIKWRSEGIEVFYSVDAGANVHCVCGPGYGDEIATRLERKKYVVAVATAHLGGPAMVTSSKHSTAARFTK